MSTLDGPIWSRCSIALTCRAHRARKNGARVRMNVTAHQEKKKNEETKKGKSRARERKK